MTDFGSGLGREPETVVALHGLGRGRGSMARMCRALCRSGFRVVNFGYPSRRLPLAALAVLTQKALLKQGVWRSARLHFVTHSMGGVLLRTLLVKERPPGLGRTVMLAPPNKGSEIADIFGRFRLFHLMEGPAAAELGAREDSFVNRLPPVDYPVGVIAGSRSQNPVFSMFLPGRDDGTVAVARTRVPGMAGFIVVRRGHAFIMNAPETIRQTIRFLKTGHFAKTKAA